METSNPKAAIVDAIKKSTNILVTVAHDPSVDSLAAALGFSLMLNKLDKHATAVFSGSIPPAITFLEPEKTFEGTVDSLRDFIIAIDKDKADRLRYKVEGDVVRIYITPYRTNISEKDLDYSQGDFNVDMIIALGVEKQSDLDAAITAHGRILHDATVVTVNTGDVKSSIGSLDWFDDKASSLCEMLMSLSEALQSNLLDEQIATALLTGIVAATDRFSNARTTPRVMTMSAQLMAAGANQQLIAEKLEQGGESLALQVSLSPTEPAVSDEEPAATVSDDGAMEIRHEEETAVAAEPEPTSEPEPAAARGLDVTTTNDTNDRLEQALGHTKARDDIQRDLAAATSVVPSTDWRDHVHEPPAPAASEPLMGGTLNATASEAEEAKRLEQESNRNRTLLSHDAPPASSDDDVSQPLRGDAAEARNTNTLTKGKTLQPVTMAPINVPATPPVVASPIIALSEAQVAASGPVVNPAFPMTETSAEPDAAPAYTPIPTENKTLADLEAEVRAAANEQVIAGVQTADEARAAIDNLFATQPDVPAPAPAPHNVTSDLLPGIPLPPPPPLPDFSKLPPPPPELSTIPQTPHPGVTPPQQFPVATAQTAPLGQFQIPGQG